MDPQAQASFIPRKPLVAAPSAAAPRNGIFWFGGLLLFIASVVAAGAAFGYQQYLESAIASENASLTRAQAAYDPAVITDILRLNSRMAQAKTLLSKHTNPAALFSFLENNTLQNVRFTGFEYAVAPNGQTTVTLSGEALDFTSVALQSDTFGQSKALHDVVFSDVNVDPGTGHIVFKVSAQVDPSLILYANSLSSGTSAVAPAAPATASTSASGATSTAASPFGTSQ